MSVMVTEVYEAFIAAGVPEDKAKKAAQAINEKNDELATKRDIKGIYLAFGLMGTGIAYLASLIHTIN